MRIHFRSVYKLDNFLERDHEIDSEYINYSSNTVGKEKIIQIQGYKERESDCCSLLKMLAKKTLKATTLKLLLMDQFGKSTPSGYADNIQQIIHAFINYSAMNKEM